MAFNLKSIGDIASAINSVKDVVSASSDIVSSVKGDKKTDKEIQTVSTSEEARQIKPSQNTKSGIRYSDELEELINMVMSDGEVSESEMRMLNKRAEKEGIDLDEFEFVINKRLKQRKAELERSQNPVTQIADAFKIAESYATTGSSAIDGGALSSALALIPGVGAVAAVGGLATSLIKTPSNLNALKAEIINNAKIPETEKDMSDFMVFCHSQLEAELAKKNATKYSLSNMLSGVTMGDALDLEPIWKTKINHLISRSKVLFPESELIKSTIKQVYISPAGELKALLRKSNSSFAKELRGVVAPDEDTELMEIIELLYSLRDEVSIKEDVINAHKRLYSVAEQRFRNDYRKSEELMKYKIKPKMFGLF